MTQNSSQVLLEPMIFKQKRIARSTNPSYQLQKAIAKKQKIVKDGLILNQDILRSLQPSDSAMKSLIQDQREKNRKQENKLDKRITVALLDTEESADEAKKQLKIKKIKDKVQVERAQRSNALLRLNDSVAGFLLKQSFNKEERTIKNSYGYDSDESDHEATRTMGSVARAASVLNTEKKQLSGKLRKGQASDDMRSRRRS